MTENILVTGACGFIGFHVCNRLLNDGYVVYGVENFASAFANGEVKNNETLFNSQVYKNSLVLRNNPNFHLIQLDATNLDLYQKMTNNIPQISTVIHLAALPRVQYSFDNLLLSTNANIMPTVGVLNFMLQNNVKSIVYSSSSTAKTTLSPYGLQKKYNEDLLLMYRKVFDIQPVILRYHSVYGPGMDADSKYALLVPRAIKAAYTGEEFPLYGDGSVERDFTYIDDVVEATVRSFTVFKGGSDIRFDVGASNPIKVAEILEIIEILTGNTINKKVLPARVEPQQTKADTENLEKYFSFKPTISFEEGLKRLIESNRQ